ncbi:alpha/beta hydrolase family protein [Corynebacterium sp. HS2168-gen11]|uniref:alpha/beta hydrolase family protein n=1 Tax=Corynebacterium sp. HS2168-gen11 TaxID=2974027 RepID=UPI00216AE529|nr:alpha/beta hydrolase family protein [Corynebacterium sp. HS2168-gen11]MCS4536017.1 alpha/beta hydrolase family protein [Corynebacterium sp. HS2168-gen11]
MFQFFAQQLQAASATLERYIASMQQQFHHAHTSLSTWFEHQAGDGFTTAHQQFRNILQHGGTELDILAEHAHILAVTASYQAELESYFAQVHDTIRSLGGDVEDHRVLARLDEFLEYQPLFQIIVDDLYQRSQLLDQACAHALAQTRICTPDPVPPLLAPLDPASDTSARPVAQAPLVSEGAEGSKGEVLSRDQVAEDAALAEIFQHYPAAKLLQRSPAGVVISIGDIDAADVITTLVPGAGSHEPQSWPTYIARAQGIHEAVTQGPSGRLNHATVMWLHYRAPRTWMQAGLAVPALSAGARLQQFHRQLQARNPHAKHLVVAHSYGSVVAGVAARGNWNIDTLVVAGSPGIRAMHRQELHVPDSTRLVAATGTADPISLLSTQHTGIHGKAPEMLADEHWRYHSDHSGYFHHQQFLADLRAEVQRLQTRHREPASPQ